MTSQPCANPRCEGRTDDFHPDVKRADWCFSCNHWQEMVDLPDKSGVVIVGASHYMIGDEVGNPRWRGHAGRKFEIEFLDGRQLCTSNLWCQGTIPLHWREKLPGNARHIVSI